MWRIILAAALTGPGAAAVVSVLFSAEGGGVSVSRPTASSHSKLTCAATCARTQNCSGFSLSTDTGVGAVSGCRPWKDPATEGWRRIAPAALETTTSRGLVSSDATAQTNAMSSTWPAPSAATELSTSSVQETTPATASSAVALSTSPASAPIWTHGEMPPDCSSDSVPISVSSAEAVPLGDNIPIVMATQDMKVMTIQVEGTGLCELQEAAPAREVFVMTRDEWLVCGLPTCAYHNSEHNYLYLTSPNQTVCKCTFDGSEEEEAEACTVTEIAFSHFLCSGDYFAVKDAGKELFAEKNPHSLNFFARNGIIIRLAAVNGTLEQHFSDLFNMITGRYGEVTAVTALWNEGRSSIRGYLVFSSDLYFVDWFQWPTEQFNLEDTLTGPFRLCDDLPEC